MNVAARLEALCKPLGRSVLVTRDLLADLALPSGIAATPLGTQQLRGRQASTEVFALERAVPRAR